MTTTYGPFAGQFNDQFTANSQDQLAKQVALIKTISETAFGGMQKLMALNINTVKQSIAKSSATTQLLLNAKDAKDLFDLSSTHAKPNVEGILAYGRELAAISSDARTEMLKVASDASPVKFNAAFQYMPADVSSVFAPNKIVDITPPKSVPTATPKALEKPANNAKTVAVKPAEKPVAKLVAKPLEKPLAKPALKAAPKLATKVATAPAPKAKPIAAKAAAKVTAPVAKKASLKAPAKPAATPSTPAKVIKQAAPKVAVKTAVTSAPKATPKSTAEPASKTAPKVTPTPAAKAVAPQATPTKQTAGKLATPTKPLVAAVLETPKTAAAVDTAIKPQAPIVTEATPVANPTPPLVAAVAAVAPTTTRVEEVTAKPAAPGAKFPFPAAPKLQSGKPNIPGANQKPFYKAKSSAATGAKKPVRQ